MKRIVALAVILLFVGAASAFAQEPQDSASAPTATEVSKAPASTAPSIFSQALIEKAVARSAAAAQAPQAKKPFLKTPWPYVIVAAVVLVLILTLRGSTPLAYA